MNDSPIEKGHWGGQCNRTACEMPNATWYNSVTQMYYCTECANRINSFMLPGEYICERRERPRSTYDEIKRSNSSGVDKASDPR